MTVQQLPADPQIAAEKVKATADVVAAALDTQTTVAAAATLDAAAIAKILRLEELRNERELRSLEYYKSFLLPMLMGLFASLPPTIGALAAGVVMWLSVTSKIETSDLNTTTQIGEVHREIKTVEHSVNSMKDELVESVRKESRAAGVLEGKELKSK